MSDTPFGKLKKQMPKQRSDMTPEEQMATPEEGAHEQGYFETLEDAANGGRAPDPTVLNGAVGIGPLEGAIESKAESIGNTLLKGRKLFAEDAATEGKAGQAERSIGGMGMSSPPPPSGAGMGDSPYRKMTPFTKTDATNGWQPSPGIRIQDKTKSAIRPWTPGGK